MAIRRLWLVGLLGGAMNTCAPSSRSTRMRTCDMPSCRTGPGVTVMEPTIRLPYTPARPLAMMGSCGEGCVCGRV